MGMACHKKKKTGTTAEFHTMMGDDGRISIAKHMMMVAGILCGQCVTYVPSLGGYLKGIASYPKNRHKPCT